MKTKITKTILKILGILLLILVLSVLILFAVVIGRTFTYKMFCISNGSIHAAIQIPTVSFTEINVNRSALREFDGLLLRKVFPKIFSSSLVQHELVGNYSQLFRIPGSEPDLEPYMLLAHIDVVPADEADGWDAPPFSAQELNGFIYGRGTIDNKQSVMGILQASEYLLERGYTPRRSFYIGLGHDEEVNGLYGAANIVKLLKSQGVKLQYVLDEGLAVLDGIINGLDGPAALRDCYFEQFY
ncbi:hypothetical protein cypCar_00020858 [Cyprinus carpio]|nr:hypothetical protein cypCar_00020858 [Cyprinus carpio]